MTVEAVAAVLGTTAYAGRVESDLAIAGLTTYRLGGPAALYLEPAGPGDLEHLGAALRAAGGSVPLLVLGRGSNVVISDEGYPGIVLRLGAAFSSVEPSGPSGLTAGASTPLPQVANWAARRGLAGMEFAISIPGSVGGGVRMNAGAHGSEIADVLDSVTVFDLDDPGLSTRGAHELGLAYRRSNLSESVLVVSARFELRPDDPADVRKRMDAFRAHRAETQPGAAQNAGSVFKNPPGDSAGRLVEAAGFKGFRVGGATVSELHANFFIAEPGASAQDVFDLVHVVRAGVLERSGIELEPEVKFVGTFEEPAQRAVGGAR